MSLFTAFTRRRSFAGDRHQTRGADLSAVAQHAVPHGFEAVGEALVSGADATAACAVVGRDAARDGAALGEALDGLRATFQTVRGVDPDFASVHAVSAAWSEATLEYLHRLSCEDPLTGLASLAHVRTRLAELYRVGDRDGVPAHRSHALVVVEVGFPAPLTAEHRFTRVLRLVQVAETVRSVFCGGETFGRGGANRVLAVVPRRSDLGQSMTLLGGMLDALDLGSAWTRCWIEGVPPDPGSVPLLLDELARD